MASMQAVQIQKPGDISVLSYVTTPRPVPEPNQVLIKIAYAGVNYIDIYERSGLYPNSMPFIPGREGSGEVVEIGSEVQEGHFKIGDRVAFLSPGGYAEYNAVNASTVTKIPDSVSLEKASALPVQGLTAWSLVRKAYHVKKGDWVVVHAAAGGVGLLLCQMCALLGAHVIGTTSSETKAALAKANGAEHVVLYTGGYDALVQRVNELTDGKGVHAVFDGVGKDSFDTSLEVVRRLGTVVLFGGSSGPVPPLNLMRLTEKNIYLARPTLSNYVATRDEFDELCNELFDLMAKNQIQFAIHKIYPIQDMCLAHEDLEGRKTTGKLLLKVC
ncbi:NADPH:quinone reductase [Mortierella sp. GBA30]|nr:NADPH:quinone reductase [Mortierella sp. GBA30]